MNNEIKAQINELIKAHQGGQAGAADEAFLLLCEHDWTKSKKWRHVMLTGEHINEIESAYIDAFMNALDKFDPERGDFVHYVNRSVENRVRNVGRKRKQRMEIEIQEPQQADASDSRFWDLAEDYHGNKIETPEDVLLEDLTKDQKLDFIPAITQDMIGRMSDEEFQVVAAYVQTESYREAAKIVGTYPMKIQRTLDKLQKYYDAARFGDVHRFFTVNTIQSRA